MTTSATITKRAVQVRQLPEIPEEPLVGGDYDYADTFEVVTSASELGTPEEFARATLERAHPLVRGFIRFVHQRVAGFSLGPDPSPEHILGWRIETSEPHVVHLAASR